MHIHYAQPRPPHFWDTNRHCSSQVNCMQLLQNKNFAWGIQTSLCVCLEPDREMLGSLSTQYTDGRKLMHLNVP